jgi:hypothetical protein
MDFLLKSLLTSWYDLGNFYAEKKCGFKDALQNDYVRRSIWQIKKGRT